MTELFINNTHEPECESDDYRYGIDCTCVTVQHAYLRGRKDAAESLLDALQHAYPNAEKDSFDIWLHAARGTSIWDDEQALDGEQV